MIVDCTVTVCGWVCGSPVYKKFNGRDYASFIMQTHNANKNPITFVCFCWNREVFGLLRNADIKHGDNVMIRGILTEERYEKNNVQIVNLQVMVEHIKFIDTSTKRRELERNDEFNPNIDRKVSHMNDSQVSIDVDDEPF